MTFSNVFLFLLTIWAIVAGGIGIALILEEIFIRREARRIILKVNETTDKKALGGIKANIPFKVWVGSLKLREAIEERCKNLAPSYSVNEIFDSLSKLPTREEKITFLGRALPRIVRDPKFNLELELQNLFLLASEILTYTEDYRSMYVTHEVQIMGNLDTKNKLDFIQERVLDAISRFESAEKREFIREISFIMRTRSIREAIPTLYNSCLSSP